MESYRSETETLLYMEKLYLENLAVRNYAQGTIDSKIVHLRFFRNYCEQCGIKQAKDVTRKDILGFQAYLFRHRKKKDGQPMAIGTQKHILGDVQQLFGYMVREGYLLQNPTSDLNMPRRERRLPKTILTVKDIDAIMKVPDISTPVGLTNRAIIETFYGAGIRRSELVNLDIENFQADSGILQIIQGKGKKDRYTPIGKRAIKWIEKYLAEARPVHCDDEGESALFVGQTGKRFSVSRMCGKMHDIIKKSGIRKSGSTHLFRHAYATHVLGNGCDIRVLQELMGHADISATQIYTHVSIGQLQDAHARFHPAQS